MATARIGEGELVDATPRATRKTTRVGAALASPLGILVIVPGLVALVGIFLTLGGDQALRGSNLAMAGERLSDQTRLVAASVRDALDHSAPVLDRLAAAARTHDPSRPFDSFAHTLADLINGRPGIAYVSASYPDGTFQGAYVDDDRVIRFQDSRVEAADTHVRRYHLTDTGGLRLQREERTTYDPRKRDFFKLAVLSGKRVWTAPYPFYKTHYTGITRTEPVFEGSGATRRLRAVVTVDFDVNALSIYLRGRQLPGMRALLFSTDGTLLAYPQGAQAIQKLPLRSDRALRHSDLKDPVLAALFSDVKTDGRERLSAIQIDGERFLTAVAPASSDAALPWYVAFMVPDAYFLRGLRLYEHRSFVIGGIAVLTAMGIGWLFARHIVRVQSEVVAARAEAQEARRAARELGSYRLVACLGRGGMGEVWKAEHRLLAREAAIKLIKPDSSGTTSEEMRARFRREAETLANLRSRNTIELFDYGVSEDGTFYFVMELLDGMDLESFVMSYGPQPAARVIQLLAQACSSLAEAHDAGLVHRDIKPANLFVCRAADEHDLIKVLDFGLVRAAGGRLRALGPNEDGDRSELEEALSTRFGVAPVNGDGVQLTQAGGLMGTPGYMAPEQALGHTIDHRADLYSLGCVAFWLLTGRMVFEDESPMRLMLAHVQKNVPDLRAAAPAFVPDELVALVGACLAKTPAERPASARELGRALRAISSAKEHAWTPERAEAWWNQYRPRRRSLRGPPDASREFNVAVTLT
jgi:serine/threonine protein kinase